MTPSNLEIDVLSQLDVYFPDSYIEVVTGAGSLGEYIVLTDKTKSILLASAMSREEVICEMSRRGITSAILNSDYCAGEVYYKMGMSIYQVNRHFIQAKLESSSHEIRNWIQGIN